MIWDKIKKLNKPDPEAEEKLRNDIEEMGGLEKKDLPAMLIAAFLVILPVALIAIGVICLLAWLFLM